MQYKHVLFLILIASVFFSDTAMAVDSYRYLHVSIDTPWAIFVFLLVIILFPFVLMAILYWHFAFKKNKEEKQTNTKQA
ncbi:MAG: hypothetical protein GXP08_14840 [Gammaproteobacteria bacterium]|nr:hypothetical protein [Gammaproteobacteria bacterium]